MIIIEIHWERALPELILLLLWLTNAFFLIRFLNRPSFSQVRPVLIFGLVLSVLWIAVYSIALTGVFSQFVFGTPAVLHSTGNGLLIVTVIFFMLVVYTAERIFGQIAESGRRD